MNYFTLTKAFFTAAFIGVPALLFAVADSTVQEKPAVVAAIPAEKVAAKKESEKSKENVVAVPACEVSEVVKIVTPLFAEQKNLQDKTFDNTARLSTTIVDFNLLKFVPAISKDGFFSPVSVSVPAKDAPAELRAYRFYVTTKAFTKVKIKVTTPQMCEIYVDGKKLADKGAAQESIEKSGSASTEISMEMRRYEIVVKTLSLPGDKAVPAVKLELLTEKALDKAGFAFPQEKEKRPLTLADVNEGERVSGARISPDGNYVLLTYSELLPDGKSRSRIEVRNLKTEAIEFAGGNSYSWMPTGAKIYYKEVTNGKAAFVAYDLEKKTLKKLVDDLPDADSSYTWLPNETQFIVRKTEKWKNETDNFKRFANISDRVGGYRDRTFLYLYDTAMGTMQRLTAGLESTGLHDISLDSKKILFSTNSVDYTRPEYGFGSLYLLDLDTMKSEILIDKSDYDFSATFSPDGKQVLITSGAGAFGKIGCTLPEGMIPNSFDRQLFIMDLSTKKVDPITRDFNPSIGGVIWGGDGNIYFTAEDKDYKRAYRYVPAEKKFTVLNVPAENVYGLSLSSDPKEFKPIATALGQSSTVMPKAYKIDLVKNTTKELVESLPQLQTEVALAEVCNWNFKASDGTEIVGNYFLPPGFDPAKKYPMIVYYYGGTSPVSRAFGSHYSFPLWAAKGYVVYVLQPSGATGFGQEFAARHVNAWGKQTANDIIEGVKKFCAEHTFVDPKKIGCLGASYGGFMTMYLQTRTDIFAAAVSHAGISDITSYWGEGFWGTGYNAIAAAGSFPWKNKEIFVEQSPLFAADKIKTPILLCHGQADTNVPTGESIQMFAALKLLGKPVELVTFKAEDHFILEYTRRKQWMKSHLAWFERWLKDDSDWWYSLYPDANKTF